MKQRFYGKKCHRPFQDAGDSPDAPQPREMIDMEATFEKLEHELQEVLCHICCHTVFGEFILYCMCLQV